jgi:SmpA/OmlA family protein
MIWAVMLIAESCTLYDSRRSLYRGSPLDLLLDSVLRYSVPEMKTSILSALIAAALALSATAQNSNPRIALGMTFAEVAVRLGQPISYQTGAKQWWYYLNMNNPISVSNGLVNYSYIVEFDNNGRVSMFTQFGSN